MVEPEPAGPVGDNITAGYVTAADGRVMLDTTTHHRQRWCFTLTPGGLPVVGVECTVSPDGYPESRWHQFDGEDARGLGDLFNLTAEQRGLGGPTIRRKSARGGGARLLAASRHDNRRHT